MPRTVATLAIALLAGCAGPTSREIGHDYPQSPEVPSIAVNALHSLMKACPNQGDIIAVDLNFDLFVSPDGMG